jgi:hypothetical protein
MFSSVQKLAIKTAIAANELGAKSPYELCFAKLGSSGASFGTFQGDCAANPRAKSVLGQVLRAAALDAVTIGRITTALEKPCPDGNPLSASDAANVAAALNSSAGKALVDAMDNELMQTVIINTQQAADAAAAKGWPTTPVAILYIALWVNMTGAPSMLCKWITGQKTLGLAPPIGPTLADSDMQTYLQATSYFQLHPKNFDHFQQSVQSGAQVLQAPAPAPN